MNYPNDPGFKEATTSLEAAIAIEGRAETIRKAVVELLRLMDLTADETAHMLRESVLAVRPRVTELYKQGEIIRTGARRKNRSGMSAHVYRAA